MATEVTGIIVRFSAEVDGTQISALDAAKKYFSCDWDAREELVRLGLMLNLQKPNDQIASLVDKKEEALVLEQDEKRRKYENSPEYHYAHYA